MLCVPAIKEIVRAVSNKEVLDIDFDDASAYPGIGTSLPYHPSLGAQTFSLVPSTNVPFSVTSTDVNLGPEEPLDAEISFYADVPAGCDGQFVADAPWPADILTVDGDIYVPSSGTTTGPGKVPGPRTVDLHFQTAAYAITEPVGVPVDFTRFFEIHCHAEGMYQFQFCNRADVKPPDLYPSPGNDLLCETLWVLTPQAWPCPNSDSASGFDDYVDCREQYFGTDYNDDCPDDYFDDALPPDINKDKTVNILDVALYKPELGGTNPRYDLYIDGVVNILDVALFKPELPKPWPCT
jgi:hypothetical protein